MQEMPDPDYVIPMTHITIEVRPLASQCGIRFVDSAGMSYLLPIPGKVLLGLAADIHSTASKSPGFADWGPVAPLGPK